MIKSFLILLIFQISILSAQQIVLVVARDFNTSQALLECYEDGKKVFNTHEVNLGKNGLGWGLGAVEMHQNKAQPLKKEGDNKAPAGIFELTNIFGYKNADDFKLDFLHASQNLICVDDIDSALYNKLIQMPPIIPKSYEKMRREDHQYELGIVVAHNMQGVKGGGSCIFLHVEKTDKAPTAGCTSMPLAHIKNIASWLDRSKKPLLIQIPKSSSKEILKLYPTLKKSKLLQEEEEK